MRFPGGLLANTKAHEQFSEFQACQKIVRVESHRLAQLFECWLNLNIDTEGHAQEYAELRNRRPKVDGLPQLPNQFGAFRSLKHLWIAKHAD
jgi:hypothetical protein